MTRSLAVAFVLLLSCAHSESSPTLAQIPEVERADGRAVVRSDPDADRYLSPAYGGPFPDRATMVVLAVGRAARQDALAAFGAYFRGGAELEIAGRSLQGYRVVVEPLPRSDGPATSSAAVSLQVRVTLLDPQARPTWGKTFDSGTLSGPLYFRRGVGLPELAPAAHDAIARLLQRAAAETAAEARRAAAPG